MKILHDEYVGEEDYDTKSLTFNIVELEYITGQSRLANVYSDVKIKTVVIACDDQIKEFQCFPYDGTYLETFDGMSHFENQIKNNEKIEIADGEYVLGSNVLNFRVKQSVTEKFKVKKVMFERTRTFLKFFKRKEKYRKGWKLYFKETGEELKPCGTYKWHGIEMKKFEFRLKHYEEMIKLLKKRKDAEEQRKINGDWYGKKR